MRILVIGAGATGGYYGGKLALAGRDVTFLVREKRAEQLRRTGLVLRTPEGESTLEPKLVLAADLAAAGSFDLILLSTKAYGLESAIADMAPAVGEQTMILPVLNGMRHLEVLAGRFGQEKVLGGLCRIVGDLDAEGRVLQMTELNELAYGELSGEKTERIERVHATLSGVGFHAVLAESILNAMWVKWMLLASLGSINVLSRGSIGTVRAVEELEGVGLRFAAHVLEESFAVATAYGYPPDAAAEAMVRGRLTEPGSTLESSMYRDFTRGYSVEAMQIVGDMVLRARRKQVPTPLLEAAFVQLRIYEKTLPR
ncbi:MAG: 2-dehydropantoate 2-reductase [Acidobacteriaceae bacterium]|nr:2-dehydropantoate 2-reductase [Acidobacteriaceae bacterium]